MPEPNPAHPWQANDSLATRIASLADEYNPVLRAGAFRTSEFLRSWEQKEKPNIVLAPLFFELGVIEPDPNKTPVDTFLHNERLEYETLDEKALEVIEFKAVELITVDSAFSLAFQEYRSRVQDQRDRFLDIPLDRAESFGQFVVVRALPDNDGDEHELSEAV